MIYSLLVVEIVMNVEIFCLSLFLLSFFFLLGWWDRGENATWEFVVDLPRVDLSHLI
jgi:hypothetical protein